jgi:hypothetical protein
LALVLALVRLVLVLRLVGGGSDCGGAHRYGGAHRPPL